MASADKKPGPTDELTLALLGDAFGAWVHRLNNTLGTVPFYIQLIRENPDDKEQLFWHLEQIEEDVRETLQFARETRDLSRYSAASGIGPVATNSVIQKTYDDHYKALENRENAPIFQLYLAEDLPEVTADERLLGEVIRNIVDNSLQAIGERNDGLIEIRTHQVDDNVAIDITDNGPGIPTNLVPRLFEKGYTSKQGKGLGFGLFLSRSLVESWRGYLNLITSDSTGTTFRVVLTHWQIPVSVSSAKRAIVVDDNSTWRNVLAQILGERELTVDMAASFQAAINLVEVNDYDLAFLDVRLEDIDFKDTSGLRIARLLRERNPEVIIVVLTGYGSVSVVRDAFRAGVDDVLDKSGSLIVDEIRNVLDKVAVRRETERESIRQSQLNRLMYEVLSMISHELRTPLVTIKLNTEALSMGALGPLNLDQNEAVETIRSAVRRESLLLNAHLDLNRIEKGAERLDYQEYDLVALVREEVLAHRTEADRKGVQLKTHIPRRKAIVKIDVNRFRVALNPLMDNAIKFSPEGGEVAVRVTLSDDYVEVLVTDQGPGIKPAELDQLLNWRDLEMTDFTQRIRSSGLGLRMAKRMIELHAGRLWVESDGKSGTTVGFRLSVLSEDQDDFQNTRH